MNLTIYLKSKFREIRDKFKVSPNSLENVNTCQFEGAEYKSDKSINF